MDVHLFSNEDGTSSGFMVTENEIVMVVKDKIYRLPNTKAGEKMIEDAITHLESDAAKRSKQSKGKRKSKNNTDK